MVSRTSISIPFRIANNRQPQTTNEPSFMPHNPHWVEQPRRSSVAEVDCRLRSYRRICAMQFYSSRVMQKEVLSFVFVFEFKIYDSVFTVLQNVNSGWQSLNPSSAVADYLSHLPANTLPLSLHHFLKYSAETIKKEVQPPVIVSFETDCN